MFGILLFLGNGLPNRQSDLNLFDLLIQSQLILRKGLEDMERKIRLDFIIIVLVQLRNPLIGMKSQNQETYFHQNNTNTY